MAGAAVALTIRGRPLVAPRAPAISHQGGPLFVIVNIHPHADCTFHVKHRSGALSMITAQLDELYTPGTGFSRRARVRAEGIEVVETRRSGAIVCQLCRKLIEAGLDPTEPMEVWRGNILALRVKSIGQAAKLTVDESGTPRFAKWKPRPSNLE
jgi:hypothetical protein